MNPIPYLTKIGTIGELLVQVRLLQYGVQAAPPLKDSGNDLIATYNEVFRAVQVKTTTKSAYSRKKLPNNYHILAVVHLVVETENISLDKSRVFLIPKNRVMRLPTSVKDLNSFLINKEHVDSLFAR